jgi:mono/diheme cytochrome c family protein
MRYTRFPKGRRIRSSRLSAYAAIILLLVSMVSCMRNPTHPGFVYLPDMDNSRAYETYTANPVFDDSSTMRLPVEGTIPRGYVPYPYIKTDEDLAEAGRVLTNPMEASVAHIQRGEVLYARFCSVCHGQEGDGQGILYTSGRFPLPPGDLTSEKVIQRTDGEIFHIITVGYGIMAPYGTQVPADARWQIIHYLRQVLQDTTLQQ